MNIVFYTQELGKTINKLMELNTENVRVVETINHLMNLTLEMVEHIKVIVKNAQELNYKNGEKQIENTTTNITENINKNNRFFYCAKASKKDRNEGLDNFEDKKSRKWRDDKGMKFTGSGNPRIEVDKNIHPTVKPTKLMEYLIKLITPKGGVVLDLFMGSGSTGKAAVKNGFNFIGIEREKEYFDIAKARIEHAKGTGLFKPEINPDEL